MKKPKSVKGSVPFSLPTQIATTYEVVARQRELEILLQASETNYHELYEFAPVGYFDLDENNRIIKVNLGGTQLLETPRIRLLGKRFSFFINKNSRATFYTHIKQVHTTKIKQYCELELLKEDGLSFYAQIESILVSNLVQNTSWVHLAITDIGERRRTEQALHASEEKFRSIIETTKEWIWTINLRGQFLYSNPAVQNILGYSTNELLSSSRFLLIHKDDRHLVNKIISYAVNNKQGWSDLVLRWRCKDGDYRYLESNAVPFFNSQGKVAGFRGADRDITSRRQAEEQVRQHQAELNQVAKMNSLGELASTLAHELTQPLTAINNFITGSIKKLAHGSGYDAAVLDALQQAAQQAERAGQLIHRMKDFIRRGKLCFEKVDIHNIIYQSIGLIKNEFPTIPVKIHFEPMGISLLILADKIQLEQVMLNLLRNSIEAMIDHSTPKPEIHIKCIYHPHQYIMVNLSDNGHGFCDLEDIDIERIFKTCFTTKSNGLGLGLAISRTLIEAHRGHLSAYKNLGNKGACLQFTLPIYQEYRE